MAGSHVQGTAGMLPSTPVNGTQPAAAAPSTRQPTPEQQAAASEQLKNNPGMTAHWDGNTYSYVPGPQTTPINAATTAGTNAVQDDITRRQGAPNPFQITQGSVNAPTGPALPSARNAVLGQAPLTGPQGGPVFQAPVSGQLQQTGPTTTAPGLNGPGPAAPTAVTTAAQDARNALGPAPQIDMGLADRQQGNVNDALDLSKQVVNGAMQPVDQTGLNQATADARSVLDQLLNGPNTADRLGSQTLRSQLALARSAAGGPGAVQEALRNAQGQAPELQAQAAQQATAETMQRLGAAGNVSGQLQTAAIGAQTNDTNRLNVAANAASGFATGALGAKGQDIDIAGKNQAAATNLLDTVAQVTGQTLDIDERNKELVGQMARDMNATNYNWGALDVGSQEKEFDRWVTTYGIDTAAAAQIKAAAIANHKGVMDYLMPIVGAIATVGSAGLAGKK